MISRLGFIVVLGHERGVSGLNAGIHGAYYSLLLPPVDRL